MHCSKLKQSLPCLTHPQCNVHVTGKRGNSRRSAVSCQHTRIKKKQTLADGSAQPARFQYLFPPLLLLSAARRERFVGRAPPPFPAPMALRGPYQAQQGAASLLSPVGLLPSPLDKFHFSVRSPAFAVKDGRLSFDDILVHGAGGSGESSHEDALECFKLEQGGEPLARGAWLCAGSTSGAADRRGPATSKRPMTTDNLNTSGAFHALCSSIRRAARPVCGRGQQAGGAGPG